MARSRCAAVLGLALLHPAPGFAESTDSTPPGAVSIRVEVAGFGAGGEVGCGLYRQAAGFPTDPAAALRTLWQPASGERVICEFKDLPAGSCAVTASHDTNGNRIVDTNLFGMPKEAWGVSGGVRPRLRAPRFDEARIETPASGELRLEVRVQ